MGYMQRIATNINENFFPSFCSKCNEFSIFIDIASFSRAKIELVRISCFNFIS